MTQAVALAQQASTGVSQGFKNRIINGAMVIDQRNAGASVTNVASASTYTLDRWFYFASQASKFTVQQDAGAVTPPVGFNDYLGITSSSSYTVGASEIFLLAQHIEGYNVADLGWGTANAKTVTLSFWVRSSLTGTFGGSLRNDASDRSYPFTYTISVANTWEQKSITVAGDTSGTWLTTNGTGIRLAFGLGMGSTFSGTAGAWAAANYISATGATSVVGTNGATFYITGVQLEVGSTATSFDYLDYGRSLIQCQRYYYLWAKGNSSTTQEMGSGFYLNNTEVDVKAYLPVSMRTNPTLSQVTGTNYYRFTRSGGNDDVDSLTLERCNPSNTIISLYNDTQVSGTGGVAGNMLSNNASAFIAFQAEL
jgi:hypothetical protein